MYRWPTSFHKIGTATPPPADGGGTTLASGATVGITRVSPAHTIFSPTAWLNLALPDNTTRDLTNESAVVTEIVRQANLPSHPAVQATKWSLPTVTVPAGFPNVPVKIHDNPVPSYKEAMQEILLSPGVPVWPEYVSQGDSDSEAIIYDPTNDLIHEFWRLKPLATPTDVTWTFGDGTTSTFTCNYECTSYWQITQVSIHKGRSRNHNSGSYPHAPTTDALRRQSENTNMSVAAARLPFSGTLLTFEDVVRALAGHPVTHCINLSVAYALSSPGYVWPASSTDGATAGNPVKEGMRLRLPPGYVIPSTLHPLCQIIMQAVRDYGFILVDKTGGSNLEVDVEPEVSQYFDGTAGSAILNGFPWPDLQLVATGSDTTPIPTS